MVYKCPFDGAVLTRLEDHYCIPFWTCPSCNQEYLGHEISDLEATKAKRVEATKRDLEQINQRKPELERLLGLVGEVA